MTYMGMSWAITRVHCWPDPPLRIHDVAAVASEWTTENVFQLHDFGIPWCLVCFEKYFGLAGILGILRYFSKQVFRYTSELACFGILPNWQNYAKAISRFHPQSESA